MHFYPGLTPEKIRGYPATYRNALMYHIPRIWAKYQLEMMDTIAAALSDTKDSASWKTAKAQLAYEGDPRSMAIKIEAYTRGA